MGGIDIRLRTAAGDVESLELAARALNQVWPDAVFAHGETGERYEYGWMVPFSELEEVFVYRDGDSADLWFDEGAVPEAMNRMIHLLRDPGLLTVVVDDSTEVIEEAIEAIKSALADDVLRVPVLT